MFYNLKLKKHVRVPPNLFKLKVEDAILQQLKKNFEGLIDKDLGIVIDVLNVDEVTDGVIIPGDGATYYSTVFEIMSYKPEVQEVVLGKIRDIADFGAFIIIGPVDGMIHISQTMDDFVSFSKDKVLLGKETKRSLRVNDVCAARIIAVSYKDITNPKFGLTMRQPGLGRFDWIAEDAKGAPKRTKEEKSSGKKEKMDRQRDRAER